MIYSDKFKSSFRDNILKQTIEFYNEGNPFILYLKNNNDWDKEFTPEIKSLAILEITFSKEVFEHCYMKDGKLIIEVQFGETIVKKELNGNEIIAIFDDKKQPIMFKPFKEEDIVIRSTNPDDYELVYKKDNGIIKSLLDNNVFVRCKF